MHPLGPVGFFGKMKTPISRANDQFTDRLHKLNRQKFLNSEEWETLRLDTLAHHSHNGNIYCFTCGRTLKFHQATVHHMRHPRDVERIIPARDLIPICGKCHAIIRRHPEMENPELSKRKLKRLMTQFFQQGGAKQAHLGLLVSFSGD